jgi:hypothetical protein
MMLFAFNACFDEAGNSALATARAEAEANRPLRVEAPATGLNKRRLILEALSFVVVGGALLRVGNRRFTKRRTSKHRLVQGAKHMMRPRHLAIILLLAASCSTGKHPASASASPAISTKFVQRMLISGPNPSMGKLALPAGFDVVRPLNGGQSEWTLVERKQQGEEVWMTFTRGGSPKNMASEIVTVDWWRGWREFPAAALGQSGIGGIVGTKMESPEKRAARAAAFGRQAGRCYYFESTPEGFHTWLPVPGHSSCDHDHFPEEQFLRLVQLQEDDSAIVAYEFNKAPTAGQRYQAIELLNQFALVPK